MSIVGHVGIDGLGIVVGVLAPDVPGPVVGGGCVGRNNINLKIVAPHFAGAVKCWGETDDAGFLGNVGDKFDLPPAGRAVEWPVHHQVGGKNPSADVRDHHVNARPVADVTGFHPAGDADALSEERRVLVDEIGDVARGRESRGEGAGKGVEVVGGTRRSRLNEAFDVPGGGGVGRAPGVGVNLIYELVAVVVAHAQQTGDNAAGGILERVIREFDGKRVAGSSGSYRSWDDFRLVNEVAAEEIAADSKDNDGGDCGCGDGFRFHGEEGGFHKGQD